MQHFNNLKVLIYIKAQLMFFKTILLPNINIQNWKQRTDNVNYPCNLAPVVMSFARNFQGDIMDIVIWNHIVLTAVFLIIKEIGHRCKSKYIRKTVKTRFLVIKAAAQRTGFGWASITKEKQLHTCFILYEHHEYIWCSIKSS